MYHNHFDKKAYSGYFDIEKDEITDVSNEQEKYLVNSEIIHKCSLCNSLFTTF